MNSDAKDRRESNVKPQGPSHQLKGRVYQWVSDLFLSFQLLRSF